MKQIGRISRKSWNPGHIFCAESSERLGCHLSAPECIQAPTSATLIVSVLFWSAIHLSSFFSYVIS